MEFKLEEQEVGEGEIRLVEMEYHGMKVVLVEMEHHIRFSPQIGRWEKVPPNWRKRVEEACVGAGTVFLEYFPPDLRRGMNFPVVGWFVGRWVKEKGIDMFGEMGEIAADAGAQVAVADVASGPLYALRELCDRAKWRKRMSEIEEIRNRSDYLGDFKPEVDPAEFEMERAVDARRLMTARALMQELLREGGKGKVVWIGPPAHGRRIEAYIQRQKEAEGAGGDITAPEQMADVCMEEERKKARSYRNTVGFDCWIRYFNRIGGKWRRVGVAPIW